jgi:ADP-ribose pyrophosphatase YjhB (NUDIX family)
MEPNRIRPIAIGIFRRDDSILVVEGWDEVKQQHFYRPLGGAVAFGERGHEALVREMREEIGAEIVGAHYWCMIENLFTFNGVPGHEIVLVYEARLADPALYNAEIAAVEDDGVAFTAIWKPLTEFTDATPLYPDGLLALLETQDRLRKLP